MCTRDAMCSGTVRNWFTSSRGKGYGFIIPDLGGEDVFVHRRHLVNVFRLSSGATVMYEVQMNSRKNKPQAVKVMVVEPSNSNLPEGKRSHSSHSSHGWSAEPRQWCAREDIWSAAWDPQEWLREPAVSGESIATNEGQTKRYGSLTKHSRQLHSLTQWL